MTDQADKENKLQKTRETFRSLVPAATLQQMYLADDKPKTLSILILDRSGSMLKYGDAPRACVNEHLEKIKNPPDGREQYCTVITFCDDATIEIPVTRADLIKPLEAYVADGHTLLWQTVHETLKLFCTMFKVKNPPNLKVFVGVISDGVDNRSDRNLYPQKTQKWAKRARELGFELFCYGIGVDGKMLARDMGFPDDDQHAFTLVAAVESVRDSIASFTASSTSTIDPAFWKKR